MKKYDMSSIKHALCEIKISKTNLMLFCLEEGREYEEFQANKGPWVRGSCKERRRRFTPVRYVRSGTTSNYPRAPIIVVKLSGFAASLFAST